MRTQLRLALAAVAALALIAPAARAEEKTGTITGKITFQGKPLTDGIVRFSGQGAVISSKVNADGTYSVRQMPVGEVRIAVESKTVAIPKRYAFVNTSGLKLEVKPGKQTHDIRLTD